MLHQKQRTVPLPISNLFRILLYLYTHDMTIERSLRFLQSRGRFENGGREGLGFRVRGRGNEELVLGDRRSGNGLLRIVGSQVMILILRVDDTKPQEPYLENQPQITV